jgi:toxin ParE1/3/4
VEQRDLYAGRIMSAIQDLLSHPELGSVPNGLAPGLRNHRAGQHMIFYRIDERSIRIIRIIHAKMDLAAHLRDSP